ncbi:MAG: ABC transporter substrate-binding protein [candidate division Zixibacteria bacterium]|nr:ABC transporter substrate-binding protein [candidate division Zixibacteria bacterium]
MPYRKAIICSICLLIVLLSVMSEVQAADIKLAVVYSDSLNATLRTIRGIKSAIEKSATSCEFHEFLLTTATAEIDTEIESIQALNPRLILTVGSHATKAVSDRIVDIPIIFSAVLNPETSGFVKSLEHPGGNITGASLDIPFNIQFTYFKRVIQNLKTIGVLYTAETANLIPPAKALAKAADLELIAMEVTSEKDIPDALDQLNRQVDGIWSVADGGIFTPRSTRFILLNTLRNAKPLMGFSRNLVESGALFSLDYDYKDIGRQAGKIALRVLSGESPSKIPVAVPSFIWFHYNEKTAKHIDVHIPDDLVAVAKEVYK